jgi:hypothetical protein
VLKALSSLSPDAGFIFKQQDEKKKEHEEKNCEKEICKKQIRMFWLQAAKQKKQRIKSQKANKTFKVKKKKIIISNSLTKPALQGKAEFLLLSEEFLYFCLSSQKLFLLR